MVASSGIRRAASSRWWRASLQPAEAEVSPAQRVDVSAVVRLERDRALDELERLVQLLAAVRPHVAEVVERPAVLGVDRERALEGGFRLGEAPQSFVGDAQGEHQVEVGAPVGRSRGVGGATQDGDHLLEARALLVVLHEQQHGLPVVDGGELVENLAGLVVATELLEHLGLLDLVAVTLEVAGTREQLLLGLEHLERFTRLAGLGQAVGEQEYDLARAARPRPPCDRLRAGA